MKAVQIFLLSLLLLIIPFLFSSPVFAQTANTNPYSNINTDSSVPKNSHTLTQSIMIDVMSAMSCQISGIDPSGGNKKCLGVDQKTGQIGFVENGKGAIGLMGNMITMLYTPPIRTGDYIHDIAQNFGISKKAYADNPCSSASSAIGGTGVCGLRPLLGLWTTFRNISYLLFVLVFMVIGMAIMLRIKIDPRTVMTIENQIPKIIVGLVLVTFSYAIAGVLIDLMYASIYLTSNVVISADPHPGNINGLPRQVIESTNTFDAAQAVASGGSTGSNILSLGAFVESPATVIGNAITPIFKAGGAGNLAVALIGAIVGKLAIAPVAKDVGGAVGSLIGGIFTIGAAAATDGAALPAAGAITNTGGMIGSAIGSILGFGVAAASSDLIISSIANIVAFLVLSVALLAALFRLWFALIAAYIFLLMDVIFAPFWVIAGLIPGSPISFSSWVRDVVANLAVFPVTIVMLLLTKVLMDSYIPGIPQFVPPMIGSPIGAQGIAPIIGLGIILSTPEVLKITKGALKAPKINLSAPGQMIGIGAAFPAKVGGRFNRMLSARNEVKMVRGANEGEMKYGRKNFLEVLTGR